MEHYTCICNLHLKYLLMFTDLFHDTVSSTVIILYQVRNGRMLRKGCVRNGRSEGCLAEGTNQQLSWRDEGKLLSQNWGSFMTSWRCRFLKYKILTITLLWSWGSSVSIVFDYSLYDWGWSPPKAMDFSSSLCVETGSGAHPASCLMGTGRPFPRGEAQPGHDADH
jgi:hypothetical protein